MSDPETLSLVGAVGGAGTTRLAVEFATILARDGRDVAVLDAAYATQGLAQYVDGRIDPDVTALCLDDEPLAAGLVDLPIDLPGRVALCPAFAPFERVARAKTPEAARAFEELVEGAAGWFDFVLVDTPPVAANQAVAAVNGTDRVALVTPATRRGLDALPRAAGRLADVGVGGVGGGGVGVGGVGGGVEDHHVIANHVPGSVVVTEVTDGPGTVDGAGRRAVDEAGVGTDDEAGAAEGAGTIEGAGTVEKPDVVVPESRIAAPTDAPTVVEDGTFAVAVATAIETVLEVELDVEGGEEGLGRYLPG